MKLLDELTTLMNGIDLDWHLCGGYAIDVFLGDETRKHKDIDVTITFADLNKCIDFFKSKGWRIEAPVGEGRLVPIEYAITHPELNFNNLFCFRKQESIPSAESTEIDFVEVLFNRVSNGLFYYKRNHLITRSVEKAFVKVGDLSILAPEIVLLYKSTDSNNPDYQHDFDVSVGKLDQECLDWFVSAMNISYPQGHPWIRAVRGADTKGGDSD